MNDKYGTMGLSIQQGLKMNNIFIPEKIQVGFVERKDTYTGKLAYIIYWDAKGVLRKEVSWEGWRDKKIEAQSFDNEPHDGFLLNKGIERFNWSHFGSNRSYIRMYDDRGIEFEITPENLIGILTETNCNKRGLDGKFVYAWKGKELILLPCNSQEYKDAKEYTELQSKKISARDLIPGCSYTDKKGDEIIYVGRFKWYGWSDKYDNEGRTSKNQHIFYLPKKPAYGNNRFFYKSSVSFLAVLNSPDPVQNYAEIIEEWNKDIRSSDVKKWEKRKINLKAEKVFSGKKNHYGNEVVSVGDFTKMIDDNIEFYKFGPVTVYRGYGYGRPKEDEETKYAFLHVGSFNTKTMKYHYRNGRSRYHYGSISSDDTRERLSKEEALERMNSGEFCDIKMVLESNNKIKMDTIGAIAQG